VRHQQAMTGFRRASTGVALSALLAVAVPLRADTVELSVHDGRLSLTATDATPAQIFQAWSRAGGVLVVNAERMPSTPLTLTMENVPEEQALETLLRAVTGYLARRRAEPSANTSVFDRIVIMPTPVGAAPPSVPVPTPAARRGNGIVFPQPPPPQRQPVFQAPQNPPAPAGIPQAPGVTRLIGPDGRPLEDDQGDAPPQLYTPGDTPDTRSIARPAPMPPTAPPQQQQQPQQPAPPSTSAPAGVPRPGMVVPVPNTPGQPTQPAQQPQPQR
jgi:hypothetical protein